MNTKTYQCKLNLTAYEAGDFVLCAARLHKYFPQFSRRKSLTVTVSKCRQHRKGEFIASVRAMTSLMSVPYVSVNNLIRDEQIYIETAAIVRQHLTFPTNFRVYVTIK